MESTTRIDTIDLRSDDHIPPTADLSSDLSSIVMDFSQEQPVRIKAFEAYCDQIGEDAIELMSKITGMYQFSGISVLQKFLFRICSHGQIPVLLKLEAAKSLLSFEENEDEDKKGFEESVIRNKKRLKLGFSALDYVCYSIGDPTPCRIDAICTLMNSADHKKEADTYFRELISDTLIECDYRYKAILSLERYSFENKLYFLERACLEFIFLENNATPYRILAAQKLLTSELAETSEQNRERVCAQVLKFAQDADLDYNLRADAADLLLGLGSDETKIEGRKIIDELGAILGPVRTVFENAQNVHTKTIEDSAMEMLEYLFDLPIYKVDGEPITFEQVRAEIAQILPPIDKPFIICKRDCTTHCQICKTCMGNDTVRECSDECKRRYKIEVGLNRIHMDRALYSKYNFALSKILVGVWSFVAVHNDREELEKRLIEELYDMSGTCSSGYAERLVNVMSGFCDLSLKISWSEQITANFSGRINARAREIESEDSPFRKEKLREIVGLWLNTHPDVRDNLETYQKFQASTTRHIGAVTAMWGRENCDRVLEHQAPPSGDWENVMKRMIDEFLSEDRDTKVELCVTDFSEAVINEMTVITSQWDERKNFSLFLGYHLSFIKEELWEEFKEHLSDTDIDLYIRTALIAYERQN
jgi:hypothetical protein